MTNPIGSVDRWTLECAGKDGGISRNAPPFATISGLDADLDPACSRQQFRQGGFHGATTKRFSRLLVGWQNTTRRRARRTFRRKCQHVSAPPRIAPVSALTKRRIHRSCWVRRYPTITPRWMRCAPNEGAMMAQYLGDRGVRP